MRRSSTTRSSEYRRAIDLDPSERRPGTEHRHRLHRPLERNAGTPDAGHLLVALGSLADYLAWRSDGGPYALAAVPGCGSCLPMSVDGQAFEECPRTTLRRRRHCPRPSVWQMEGTPRPSSSASMVRVDGIIKGEHTQCRTSRGRHDEAASPATHWPFSVHDGQREPRSAPSACASGGGSSRILAGEGLARACRCASGRDCRD